MFGRPRLMLSLILALSAGPLLAYDTPSAFEESPEGWSDLLATSGPSLKGWVRVTIPPGGKPRGAGNGQWSYDPSTAILTCQGDQGHEWLRWNEEIFDAILHVEWRFVPVEGKRGYNSGIYLRNSVEGKVWHQAQTGDGSGGFLFGETPVAGAMKRVNLSKELRSQRVKPAGEWNTYEFKAVGKELTLWVNGAVTSVMPNCELARGFAGLEAEGWRIEFRNVRLKRLGDGRLEARKKG